MRTQIPRDRDKEKWLRQRVPYFNASDSGALFGEHPFTTLADIATNKLTGTRTQDTEATRRGNHLEAALAGWWEEEHGLATYEPTDLYICDDLLMCTLDRRVYGVDNAAVEIKTTHKRLIEPERYWYWQTQAQMACTGFDLMFLVVLDASMSLQTYEIEADEDAQTELLERAEKFMSYLRRGEVPPEVDLSYRNLATIYPQDTGTYVFVGADEAAPLVVRLATVRKMQKEAKEEEDRIKARIADIMGSATQLMVGGRAAITWKTQPQSKVDVVRLRRDMPKLIEEYTQRTTVRVMRVLGTQL